MDSFGSPALVIMPGLAVSLSLATELQALRKPLRNSLRSSAPKPSLCRKKSIRNSQYPDTVLSSRSELDNPNALLFGRLRTFTDGTGSIDIEEPGMHNMFRPSTGRYQE